MGPCPVGAPRASRCASRGRDCPEGPGRIGAPREKQYSARLAWSRPNGGVRVRAIQRTKGVQAVGRAREHRLRRGGSESGSCRLLGPGPFACGVRPPRLATRARLLTCRVALPRCESRCRSGPHPNGMPALRSRSARIGSFAASSQAIAASFPVMTGNRLVGSTIDLSSLRRLALRLANPSVPRTDGPRRAAVAPFQWVHPCGPQKSRPAFSYVFYPLNSVTPS
jgi:hypothetical protein